MKTLLLASLLASLAACGSSSESPDGSAGGGSATGGGGGNATGGGAGATGGGGGAACGNTIIPGAAGDGALRGCSGCDAPRASCGAGEYEVSAACHPASDGGWYAVNGVAGSWCYPSPTRCGATPTCQCLMENGAFAADGGLGLQCPGSYWFCIDLGGPRNLHCNPP